MPIEHKLTPDVLAHRVPRHAFAVTASMLRENARIWHAMALPPVVVDNEDCVLFTGHINCHDCALCEIAGDVRYGGRIVPWRRIVPDCTDDDAVHDSFSRVNDAIVGPLDVPLEIAELLRAVVFEPAAGRIRFTGRRLTRAHAETLDEWIMTTPAVSGCRPPTWLTDVADALFVEGPLWVPAW